MNTLKAAIFSKFNTSPRTTFYNAVSGRFYYVEAPQDTAKPYAVYQFPSGVAANTFDGKIKDLVMQIKVFSDGASSSEADDIAAKCTAVFDYLRLTVGSKEAHFIPEAEPVSMKVQENPTEPGYWMAVVGYRVLYQKS